jgi:hypothetical protein
MRCTHVAALYRSESRDAIEQFQYVATKALVARRTKIFFSADKSDTGTSAQRMPFEAIAGHVNVVPLGLEAPPTNFQIE